MSRKWQLQEAKNKLSDLVNEAVINGPQYITKRGIEAVVVISYQDYKKLLIDKEPISHFFRKSPLVGLDLHIERDTSPVREAEIL